MIISNDRFFELVDEHIGRDLQSESNKAQYIAVAHGNDKILQIVAGPGSGKTTVLVLRALRYVFVEGVLPENIVLTTFTRKAAQELRTRWLDWGTLVYSVLQAESGIRQKRIDLNRCRIDTLDSICQQAMTDYRSPGTLAPMVVETSASNLILKRTVFQESYHAHKALLNDYLADYTFDRKPPRNQGIALKETKRLIERLLQDCVDLHGYASSGHAQRIIVEMLEAYRNQAINTNIFDFVTLEDQFLRRISEGLLDDWLQSVKVMLVDEYQDTNPLQEAIYFAILNAARPSMTIVGDDDQSLYRFRGGSVELFTDFATRCNEETGCEVYRVDMTRNFRSRPEIIHFYNKFIDGDPEFRTARINNPGKPLVVNTRDSAGIPVFGIFRPNQEELARDLAMFVKELFENRIYQIHASENSVSLVRDSALGDAVFLAHSVEEVKYDSFNNETKTYFPRLFRNCMEEFGLSVFNPRGQALRDIKSVRVLLGLVILAVDPDGTIIENVRPTNEAKFYLRIWKNTARAFKESDPIPNGRGGLGSFISDWQCAGTGTIQDNFPPDWPVLELVFKLLTWMPQFQRDPEHQVWLEAITRILASAGLASPYRMHLYQNTVTNNLGVHVRRSRESLVRDALLPIAEDEVEVDEDIVPSVPRDRLQLMTIHQVKGLEFPLVIVDVGSRFQSNHHTQQFLRYPKKPSNVTLIEDHIEPFLKTPLRGSRKALDRTFDDLVRLYYVAYSRPQSVLILVGCENCLYHTKNIIPNVALGWQRCDEWPWRQPYEGKRPPVHIDPPFTRI